jgi:signal transduction histidine kinase
MNSVSFFHAAAVLTNIVLGVAVYRTNPRRTTNRFFLLLSAVLSLWLVSLAMCFGVIAIHSTVLICMRICHSVAAFFPLCFDLLRLGIIHPEEDIYASLKRNRFWFAAACLMAVLSQTRFIVADVSLPVAWGARDGRFITEPVFGVGYASYAVFYLASMGLLVTRFYRSVRGREGIQRAELQFILLGSAIGLIVASLLVFVAPIFIGSSQSVQYAPYSIIVLDSIIAYGIATRRIMEIADFFRTVTAYALLTLYLTSLYLGVWWLLSRGYRELRLERGVEVHVIAALAVAFSLAPTHGRMQRFANRLFVHFAPMDVNAVVQSANQILQYIGTVEKLLGEFAEIVCRAVGTDRVIVLLPEDGGFVQKHPSESGSAVHLAANDPLARLMSRTDTPLVPDIARRAALDPEREEACRVLDRLQIKAAIGMRSKERLEGLVLVGPRLSGRIYGAPEQQALQLLSNQLAVALNNARLYTQVQDGKIYNDILVDNLASGVIAADNTARITVFNREAQRITRQDAGSILRQSVDALPPELASLLTTTLRQGFGLHDQELTLHWPSGEETPVRVSSSIFYGHAANFLGAFLVLNDLTAVKRLEMQVRRSDRLASLGTLAAGMAHEIKNPLVSIKTFTQLLPERYDDTEFRDSFLPVVSDEVRRIDSLVNQLLHFSRPAKPNLVPTHLHDVLTNALKLMSQQMRHKDIRLVRATEAPNDRILADGDQLSQAFINLVLNAIEAMPNGGTLTVATCLPPSDGASPARNGDSDAPSFIRVSITDTGEGIKAEDMAHIFDPFFTTKSHGTGLGLSVAHGIVAEHGGRMDVTCDPAKGTTFFTFLPLAGKIGEAAA